MAPKSSSFLKLILIILTRSRGPTPITDYPIKSLYRVDGHLVQNEHLQRLNFLYFRQANAASELVCKQLHV